ncbi:hypothetical protein Tco_1173130 [Tanacetum coccineum]
MNLYEVMCKVEDNLRIIAYDKTNKHRVEDKENNEHVTRRTGVKRKEKGPIGQDGNLQLKVEIDWRRIFSLGPLCCEVQLPSSLIIRLLERSCSLCLGVPFVFAYVPLLKVNLKMDFMRPSLDVDSSVGIVTQVRLFVQVECAQGIPDVSTLWSFPPLLELLYDVAFQHVFSEVASFVVMLRVASRPGYSLLIVVSPVRNSTTWLRLLCSDFVALLPHRMLYLELDLTIWNGNIIQLVIVFFVGSLRALEIVFFAA